MAKLEKDPAQYAVLVDQLDHFFPSLPDPGSQAAQAVEQANIEMSSRNSSFENRVRELTLGRVCVDLRCTNPDWTAEPLIGVANRPLSTKHIDDLVASFRAGIRRIREEHCLAILMSKEELAVAVARTSHQHNKDVAIIEEWLLDPDGYHRKYRNSKEKPWIDDLKQLCPLILPDTSKTPDQSRTENPPILIRGQHRRAALLKHASKYLAQDANQAFRDTASFEDHHKSRNFAIAVEAYGYGVMIIDRDAALRPENRDVLAYLQSNKTEVYYSDNPGDTFALLAAAYNASAVSQRRIITSNLSALETWAKTVFMGVDLKASERNSLNTIFKVPFVQIFSYFLVSCPWGRKVFTWNLASSLAGFKLVGFWSQYCNDIVSSHNAIFGSAQALITANDLGCIHQTRVVLREIPTSDNNAVPTTYVRDPERLTILFWPTSDKHEIPGVPLSTYPAVPSEVFDDEDAMIIRDGAAVWRRPGFLEKLSQEQYESVFNNLCSVTYQSLDLQQPNQITATVNTLGSLQQSCLRLIAYLFHPEFKMPGNNNPLYASFDWCKYLTQNCAKLRSLNSGDFDPERQTELDQHNAQITKQVKQLPRRIMRILDQHQLHKISRDETKSTALMTLIDPLAKGNKEWRASLQTQTVAHMFRIIQTHPWVADVLHAALEVLDHDRLQGFGLCVQYAYRHDWDATWTKDRTPNITTLVSSAYKQANPYRLSLHQSVVNRTFAPYLGVLNEVVTLSEEYHLLSRRIKDAQKRRKDLQVHLSKKKTPEISSHPELDIACQKFAEIATTLQHMGYKNVPTTPAAYFRNPSVLPTHSLLQGLPRGRATRPAGLQTSDTDAMDAYETPPVFEQESEASEPKPSTPGTKKDGQRGQKRKAPEFSSDNDAAGAWSKRQPPRKRTDPQTPVSLSRVSSSMAIEDENSGDASALQTPNGNPNQEEAATVDPTLQDGENISPHQNEDDDEDEETLSIHSMTSLYVSAIVNNNPKPRVRQHTGQFPQYILSEYKIQTDMDVTPEDPTLWIGDPDTPTYLNEDVFNPYLHCNSATVARVNQRLRDWLHPQINSLSAINIRDIESHINSVRAKQYSHYKKWCSAHNATVAITARKPKNTNPHAFRYRGPASS